MRRPRSFAVIGLDIALFGAVLAGTWFAANALPHRAPHVDVPLRTAEIPTRAAIASPEPVQVIGLPPDGSVASTPVRGELVVFSWAGGPNRIRTRMWVYADGRLIRLLEAARLAYGTGGQFTRYGEQHLTPQGVELLRSEAASSGLFTDDLDLASGRGLSFGRIEVRSGDRLVHVRWGDLPLPQDAKTATQAQADTIQQLAARLSDPASWLPASAWEDLQLRPYVPAMFAICVSGPPFDKGPPSDADLIENVLPRSAADLLADVEWKDDRWGPCTSVSTEDARSLVSAFEQEGYKRSQPTAVLEYRFFVPNPSTGLPNPVTRIPYVQVLVDFEPLLPHGEWTCSGCG
jgi:hypothetical protein